ncbi:hypothetical protein V8C35DRAFT_246175 [Trichoderma chlorosporum]
MHQRAYGRAIRPVDADAASAREQCVDRALLDRDSHIGRNVDEPENKLWNCSQGGATGRAPSSGLHQRPSSLLNSICTTLSESGRADSETKIGRACVDIHHE